MYVVNAKQKDMRTFPPPVQKFLIGRMLPVYKKIGKTYYFRKTKRLEKELREAPWHIRILVGKGG